MSLRRGIAALMSAAVGWAVVAAGPVQAATAITVKGTEIGHPAPYPEQLLPALFADDTVTRINYPATILRMDDSIAVATAGIVEAVRKTVGPVVVAGFSQGAVAVARAKKLLMALPVDQRPGVDQLSFVTIGDPAGPGGILRILPFRVPVLRLTPTTAPDTPYDSVIVNGEYDGWGDFPDRILNLVSVANALLGTAYVHGRYETIPGGLDLSKVPAGNIVTTVNSLGGHLTRYLIPTDKLPLVQPLRDIGISESIVQKIEKPLKAIVDAGYSRNDAPAGSTAAVPSPPAPAAAEQAGSATQRGPARLPASAAAATTGPAEASRNSAATPRSATKAHTAQRRSPRAAAA